MPLTLKNFNNTTPPYKTFTISWTEQSNMSSWWTYSDDATWLTAWDTAFDEFFGYSWVRLSSAWVETAEITQENSWWYGKLDITQLGDIANWDNVMIKFPVRWIKMSKSWSVVTLSITDATGRESEWFQYYAFQNTGDIEANASTTVATKPLYLWTYLSRYNWNTSQLKSLSWKTPTWNYTMWSAITNAWYNWTWWTITWWYQRCLINAYYMMKYGNPNSQSVVWGWYVWMSSQQTTWLTNSQTNATYWTNYYDIQVKLFWLEDWWGNLFQWIGWMFVDSSKNMYTALHDFTANIDTSESQYKIAGALTTTSGWYCMSKILWTNKWMFWFNWTVNNWSYNTYYCDNVDIGASSLGAGGGDWNDGSTAGAFHTTVGYRTSAANQYIGSRIMYL